MLSDGINEFCVGLQRRWHAVYDKRRVYHSRIDLDDNLPFGKLSFDRDGALRLGLKFAQRLSQSTNRSR